jgi:hypothetical protein
MRPELGRIVTVVAVAVATIIPRCATATERYFFRFNASGPVVSTCSGFVWSDEILLDNSGSAPATVRLIDLSNGGVPPGKATSFDLAPGETTSLDAKVAWHPNAAGLGAAVPLWVMHLDVPQEVIVASHGQLGLGSACGPLPPTTAATAFGRYPLPVFTTLASPGSTQYHLGVGFGEEDSHINVAIYNAAEVVATAHVEVRQSCDNSIIDSRDVQIAGDSIVQVGGFNRGTCPYGPKQGPASYDVTVKVDQPSLSIVSSVSNNFPTPMAVSTSAAN